MSTLKAEVCKINKIETHPNADRLEITSVKGWACVVRKNEYRLGQNIIYIPIDSILPEKLEKKIFGSDSKITLNKHRVRTIRLRGAYSQGLVVGLDQLGFSEKLDEGTDLTEALGITKYEPPASKMQSTNKGGGGDNPHPLFKKYTKIENIENYHELFEPDDEVIITEKIHGTNFRAGWLEFVANTFWKKILKYTGFAPSHEFVFGSHNIELPNRLLKDKHYYSKNVYAATVKQYNLKNKIPNGYVIYGEIYGPSIQKGYHYGLKNDETKLVIFDARKDDQYLCRADFQSVCQWMCRMCTAKGLDCGLKAIPILFTGKFKDVNLDETISGPSVLCPKQKIREGIVIKPRAETHTFMGRKILKYISPEYLMKDNTEFH